MGVFERAHAKSMTQAIEQMSAAADARAAAAYEQQQLEEAWASVKLQAAQRGKLARDRTFQLRKERGEVEAWLIAKERREAAARLAQKAARKATDAAFLAVHLRRKSAASKEVALSEGATPRALQDDHASARRARIEMGRSTAREAARLAPPSIAARLPPGGASASAADGDATHARLEFNSLQRRRRNKELREGMVQPWEISEVQLKARVSLDEMMAAAAGAFASKRQPNSHFAAWSRDVDEVVSKDQRRLQRWQASLLELDGRPRRTHADRLCLPRLQADRTRVSAGDGEHEKGEGRRARCGR